MRKMALTALALATAGPCKRPFVTVVMRTSRGTVSARFTEVGEAHFLPMLGGNRSLRLRDALLQTEDHLARSDQAICLAGRMREPSGVDQSVAGHSYGSGTPF